MLSLIINRRVGGDTVAQVPSRRCGINWSKCFHFQFFCFPSSRSKKWARQKKKESHYIVVALYINLVSAKEKRELLHFNARKRIHGSDVIAGVRSSSLRRLPVACRLLVKIAAGIAYTKSLCENK